MNKRMIAAAGTSVALAATGFAISTAGSASAATAKAPVATVIAAKTSYSKVLLCGYPVNRPTLHIAPKGEVVPKGGTLSLNGTVKCDGVGRGGITPGLHVSQGSGSCTTSDANGSYTCSGTINGVSSVASRLPNVRSNTLHIRVKQ